VLRGALRPDPGEQAAEIRHRQVIDHHRRHGAQVRQVEQVPGAGQGEITAENCR